MCVCVLGFRYKPHKAERQATLQIFVNGAFHTDHTFKLDPAVPVYPCAFLGGENIKVRIGPVRTRLADPLE